MACSDFQMRANRSNAQKSTGPKTPEGKARSRLNGRRHGLCATIVLDEERAAFDQKVSRWIYEQPPETDAEYDALRHAVLGSLRMDRCAAKEASRLDEHVAELARKRVEKDEATVKSGLARLPDPEALDQLRNSSMGRTALSQIWSDLARLVVMGPGLDGAALTRVRALLSPEGQKAWDDMQAEHAASPLLVQAMHDFCLDEAQIQEDAAWKVAAGKEADEYDAMVIEARVDLSREGQLIRRYESAAARDFYKGWGALKQGRLQRQRDEERQRRGRGWSARRESSILGGISLMNADLATAAESVKPRPGPTSPRAEGADSDPAPAATSTESRVPLHSTDADVWGDALDIVMDRFLSRAIHPAPPAKAGPADVPKASSGEEMAEMRPEPILPCAEDAGNGAAPSPGPEILKDVPGTLTAAGPPDPADIGPRVAAWTRPDVKEASLGDEVGEMRPEPISPCTENAGREAPSPDSRFLKEILGMLTAEGPLDLAEIERWACRDEEASLGDEAGEMRPEPISPCDGRDGNAAATRVPAPSVEERPSPRSPWEGPAEDEGGWTEEDEEDMRGMSESTRTLRREMKAFQAWDDRLRETIRRDLAENGGRFPGPPPSERITRIMFQRSFPRVGTMPGCYENLVANLDDAAALDTHGSPSFWRPSS
jgi:hypothetical protein